MPLATFTSFFAGTPNPSNGRVQVVLQPVGPGASWIPPVTMTITDPVTDNPTEASSFAQLPRPGRKPLLYWIGEQLSTSTFTCTIEGYGASIEGTLWALKNLKDTQVAILNYGPLTSWTYWITEIDISPQKREPGTNNAVRATVKFTFTEASQDIADAQTVLTIP